MRHIAVVLSFVAATLATEGFLDEVRDKDELGLIAIRNKRSSPDSASDTEDGPDIVPLTHDDSNEISSSNYWSQPDWSTYKTIPHELWSVRGKRDYEYSDYTRSLQDSSGPRLRLLKTNPKRISKTQQRLDNKRVPLGFIGVYGKKDLSEADPYSYPLEDSSYSIFDTDTGTVQGDPGELLEVLKRVPSGFFGMRGKRLFDADVGGKRAPTGFFGMRGKKRYSDFDDLYDENKREPMGFFGMRGKKDSALQLDEKRSLAQFFGRRGKKQPLNSGFFGMRGKKQPFEFRSKFVGVRGKKIPEGSLSHMNNDEFIDTAESEDVSSLNSADEKIKRVPSGFVGMRGKKHSDALSLGN